MGKKQDNQKDSNRTPKNKSKHKPQKRRLNLEEYKKELLDGKSLHMSRVPKRTKADFKKLAREEFNDDYGITLTHLMDRREDLRILLELTRNINHLGNRVSIIEEHLTQGNEEEQDVKLTRSQIIRMRESNKKKNMKKDMDDKEDKEK